MSANDDKRIQSIDLVETYAYGTNEERIQKKKAIICNKILKQNKKWLTVITLQEKKINKNDLNWPQFPDHPHRILIIIGSGSGKSNSLQ